MIKRLQANSNILANHADLVPYCKLAPNMEPVLFRSLFDDAGNDAGTDRTAAFADCKAQTFIHCNRRD